jgi:hypothetical protein
MSSIMTKNQHFILDHEGSPVGKQIVHHMYRAFQLVGQTTLDHPRSKSPVCWRLDGRAIFLLPALEKSFSSGCRRRCLPDQKKSSRLGQGTVFNRSLNAMLRAKAAFGGSGGSYP